MASRAVPGTLRTGYILAKNASKPSSLAKKFEQPFTFEEAGASNMLNSITTASNASNASTRISQQTTSTANEVAQKSAYATVAGPESHSAPFLSSKFRVPFDEGAPMMSKTLDNIVEQVDSIREDVQNERGYHIIGKVRASEDQLRKILAVGDMRIWQ